MILLSIFNPQSFIFLPFHRIHALHTVNASTAHLLVLTDVLTTELTAPKPDVDRQ